MSAEQENVRRRIYLLRHGDVSYYLPNGDVVDDPDAVVLSPAGQQQAQALGQALGGLHFDGVMHTGMPRTMETAKLAAPAFHRERGAEVEVNRALREITPGQIGHLGREVILNELIYGFERATAPGAQFARGERFDEFCARIDNAMDALMARSWETLLIAAHSGTNRAVLNWVTGGGLRGLGAFEQDPGCVNVIDVDVQDGWVKRRYLRIVNFTPDNAIKSGTRRTSLERMFDRRPDES